MLNIFKSKRRKELEAKENELRSLKLEIDQMKHWCAADSPEIGFAMLHLENIKTKPQTVDHFRNKLRNGKYTFYNYKKL